MIKNFLRNSKKRSASQRDVISFFIDKKSLTVPQLSKETGLSLPTSLKIITELINEGIIVNKGKLETSEGRPPILYSLNPVAGYFIGVDLRSDSLSIGLMNFIGEIIIIKNFDYQYQNTEESLEEFCLLIKDFIGSVNIDKELILNIGINLPGRVNPYKGTSANAFSFINDPLSIDLEKRLGYPICLENDTRGMIYGEMQEGAAKDKSDAIFINLSWGLGSSIITNGKIVRGRSGYAGEFGHCSFFDNEILCHCGKKGCLETEASGMAMHRILFEKIHEGKQSSLTDKVLNEPETVSLDDIIEATNNEDPLCIEIIEEIGLKLGKQIANLINLLNPELIIIGGALANTGEYILRPIETAICKYTLKIVNKDAHVVLSTLKTKSGVIGACNIARDYLLKKEIS